MSVYLCLFFVFFFQVPVTVYYESLCPDSVRAFVEQIHPVVSSPLGRFIDLMLIPYGKTSVRDQQ